MAKQSQAGGQEGRSAGIPAAPDASPVLRNRIDSSEAAMQPTSRGRPAGEEMAALEKEIAGLEWIVRQKGAQSMRTLGAGCWPLALSAVSALGF
jgi:hypothetical protein